MSTIEWTDETWNPTVGCSRVSPGCDRCYAVRVAAREMQDAHRGLTKDGDWTGEVRCLPERLETPLRWRKPRRVFVDSMSDLFHPDVPDEFIAQVFAVMGVARQHTFQVLTKRPQRMAAWVAGASDPVLVAGDAIAEDRDSALSSADRQRVRSATRAWQPWAPWPLPNVWLGVSVEDQRYADLRIPHLLATPAAVRFLSIEPLLGPVDLSRVLGLEWSEIGEFWMQEMFAALQGRRVPIDWVIVGGESGPGARPLDIEWIRTILAQCTEAQVPVFVKQLGAQPGFKGEPGSFHHYDEPSGLFIKALDDKKGGNPDEWPDDLRVRQYPKETRAAQGSS